MVPGLRAIGGCHPAHRKPLRREQPPHRRKLLQGAGTRVASGGRDRSAPGRRGSLHQGHAQRLMTIAVIDYGSGNLRSAAKACERAAADIGFGDSVVVTSRPEEVLAAERIVLPGPGAFADCRRGVAAVPGLEEALREAVIARGRPFLGICVGMQLMAERSEEHTSELQSRVDISYA